VFVRFVDLFVSELCYFRALTYGQGFREAVTLKPIGPLFNSSGYLSGIPTNSASTVLAIFSVQTLGTTVYTLNWSVLFVDLFIIIFLFFLNVENKILQLLECTTKVEF
jgi:hypothetical protein